MQIGQNTLKSLKLRGRDYLIFLVIVAVILSLISLGKDFLLAPPYAVSAYLAVFRRRTHYASWKTILATYLLVVAVSDLTHLGGISSTYGMISSILVVSAFITFTNLSHPPAIALAIFSYIMNDPLVFTISSLLSLGALLFSIFLIERFVKFENTDSNCESVSAQT